MFWWDIKIVGILWWLHFEPEIGICISLLIISKLVLLLEFHGDGNSMCKYNSIQLWQMLVWLQSLHSVGVVTKKYINTYTLCFV